MGCNTLFIVNILQQNIYTCFLIYFSQIYIPWQISPENIVELYSKNPQKNYV
jgi:hypothetical protein